MWYVSRRYSAGAPDLSLEDMADRRLTFRSLRLTSGSRHSFPSLAHLIQSVRKDIHTENIRRRPSFGLGVASTVPQAAAAVILARHTPQLLFLAFGTGRLLPLFGHCVSRYSASTFEESLSAGLTEHWRASLDPTEPKGHKISIIFIMLT